MSPQPRNNTLSFLSYRTKMIYIMRYPIQNRKRMAVQTAVLRTVYAAGIISAIVLAPKLSRILPSPDGGRKSRGALYARIGAAQSALRQKGLLTKDSGERLRLTEKGAAHIERILMREYAIPAPVRWDGKWRILMFDIGEKRRRVRTRLRILLQGVGFVRLQNSVWVYPYPCDEFIALVRASLASGVGELRQITADALESDRTLREHFRLP